jgi:phosphoglycerate dehydrogenase-like enzyme
MLQEHSEVDIKPGLNQEELVAIIGDYEAVVVRSATKIPAEVIQHGDRLKVIGRAGAGLDSIDIVAAKERGVKVVNCPDANTVAVAEHTMALLLALVRHLPQADISLKEGRWEKKQLMGIGLAGKTLGIIGFGRIGRQVAIRAKAFGLKVLVNQRRLTPELNLGLGVEAVDLNDLLELSDFVTLHVPAKGETENLIGAEQLTLMKPTACLINTARGTVIDEMALLDALKNGRIAGAALDVFVEEPATHNALAQHPKVIATPHIAASTQDAQQAAAITIARQVLDLIREPQSENPLSLRVVPTDKIFSYEKVDPRRIERLAQRLKADGILANPPLVIEEDGRYIVLDGATRVTALKGLNFPHLIVQIITNRDELGLHTWFHAIRQTESDKIFKRLRALPEIVLLESEPQRIWDDMVEHGGLCYLHTTHGQVWLVKPAAAVNRLDALNKLTEAYLEGNYITHTLTSNIHHLQRAYPDLTVLVIFPEYTVSQVLQIAQAGRVLPAGITRFIIPGRVLRINADLNILKSDQSLEEKQTWLNQLVIDKLSRGRVRYYQEPIYVLDE